MNRPKGNVIGGALGIGALLVLGSTGDATAAVTSGNGEPMQASPSEPPSISFTIDSIGRFDGRTGVVTVSGTFTCANAALGANVIGDVTQTKGNRTTQGGFNLSIDPDQCDGQEHEWSAKTEVFTMGRKFSGGSALVSAGARACRLFGDIIQCVEEPPTDPFRQEVTIHLRGGG